MSAKPKPKRKAIPAKLRFEVFKRDSFTCQYCGVSAPEAILQCDHIVAVAEGGKNTLINLITSCQKCNSGKGKRRLDDETEVSKAKAQADEIQTRRNQIKLMAKWYKEMDDTDALSVDVVQDRLRRFSDIEVNLTDHGRRQVARAITKHGLSKVLDKIPTAFDCPPQNDPEWEQCFKKLFKIVAYKDLPPHVSRANYLCGTLRNRLRPNHTLMQAIKQDFADVLEGLPGCYDDLYRMCCTVNSPYDVADLTLEIEGSHQSLAADGGAGSETIH
jgi:hypothetical protein